MSMHRIFAENLRRECSRYDSIAAVCAGIGINRQQFNKYLAGSSIPSALTLRKICTFLGVSEQELFIGDVNVKPANGMLKHELEVGRGPLAALARGFRNFDTEVSDVSSGLYFCYFPLPHVPAMFVRSLISVSRQSRGTTFIRLTSFPTVKGSTAAFAKGRHSGIVFANESEIYFAGFNRYPPGQFSLIILDRKSNTGQNFFTGTTTTRRGNDRFSARTVLFGIDSSISPKHLIRKLGYVHQGDSSFDPIVVSALRTVPS